LIPKNQEVDAKLDDVTAIAWKIQTHLDDETSGFPIHQTNISNKAVRTISEDFSLSVYRLHPREIGT
jgi:hypothetical protein